MRRTVVTLVAAALTVAAAQPIRSERYRTWSVPQTFPLPEVPAGNPLTDAKVELGRHLFYDTRLSGNGTQACATCHEQARAFADARPVGLGSTGQFHTRGSMSLVNVAYASVLTWANPTVVRLEDQALVPMYGDAPVELGLSGDDRWTARLGQDPTYTRLATEAFGSAGMNRERITQALASFERSIVSARSPWDSYHFDRDESALTSSARRGEVLFHSRALSCFQCHGGVNFSSAMSSGPRAAANPPEFHNTGLYNLAGTLSYPPTEPGTYRITHNPADVGRFKPPTLRNIAVTAPYMHDGSIATLEMVIEHYAAGGRTVVAGPLAGVGHQNANKSLAITGFRLTSDERLDLIAFLRSLTDEALLHDPHFANPWPARQ